jgi:hypothetical protein
VPLPESWLVDVTSWAIHNDRSLFPMSQSSILATWLTIGAQLDAIHEGSEPDHYRCPVCLYTMKRPAQRSTVRRVKVGACGHVLHLPCLLEWLTHAKTCPVCRYKL